MISRGVGVVAGAGLGRPGGPTPADGPLIDDQGTQQETTHMPTFAFSGRTRGGETHFAASAWATPSNR